MLKFFETMVGHFFTRREPACEDCGGSGNRHVCGMGACVDLDEPCPECGGSGKPRQAAA